MLCRLTKSLPESSLPPKVSSGPVVQAKDSHERLPSHSQSVPGKPSHGMFAMGVRGAAGADEGAGAADDPEPGWPYAGVGDPCIACCGGRPGGKAGAVPDGALVLSGSPLVAAANDLNAAIS